MKKLLLPLVLILAAGPAVADEDTPRWRQKAPIYNAYDLNDLEDTRPIAQSTLDFSAADEDGDGAVSRREARRYLRDYERAARDNGSREDARLSTDTLSLAIQRADTNGDGILTAEEHKNHQAKEAQTDERPSFYYRSENKD